MKLLVTGTVESLGTRQDNTVVVKFGTQEISPDDAGKLFYFRNKYCKVLLTDDNITDLEINLVAAEKLTGTRKKSPSQRLRACYYVFWEQQGMDISFEDFYNTEMEKLIEQVKTKLQ